MDNSDQLNSTNYFSSKNLSNANSIIKNKGMDAFRY